jgi:hypothetical protein
MSKHKKQQSFMEGVIIVKKRHKCAHSLENQATGPGGPSGDQILNQANEIEHSVIAARLGKSLESAMHHASRGPLLLLAGCGGRSSCGGAVLEPGDDFVEHLLDVLLRLADDLVPHPGVDSERLVVAPGAAVQLLDAGRVADGVVAAVDDEERQVHLLEAALQLAADAEQLERRGGARRRRGAARAGYR